MVQWLRLCTLNEGGASLILESGTKIPPATQNSLDKTKNPQAEDILLFACVCRKTSRGYPRV